MASTIDRENSALFKPLTIGNGTLTLGHRVVHAPLTRLRGIAVRDGTPENPCREWMVDDMVIDYYTQRATEGGLMITEGVAVNVEAGSLPGIPGLFVPEQVQAWKKLVDAVHAKGAKIYAQLWHAGRTSVSLLIGSDALCASAVALEDEMCWAAGVKFEDYPPKEMTQEDINRTIESFTKCAVSAVEEAGFDGIEIHGGNGYLIDQFLNSNTNQRTDKYGGSPENRCRFPLELMESVIKAVGQDKVALRLTPFGLFNGTRGEQRLETWGHLCREIKRQWELSYIHFVEPRYEQIIAPEVKEQFLASWGMADITLAPFREIFGKTPFFIAGGYNDTNSWGVIESGAYDAIVYGRYFLANPDFVYRLRNGIKFNKYNRDRFYGPFPDRHVGYVDYPRHDEL
ncbi:Oxophytodienoate reductase [Pyronema omphalodes]|nr:Oxophytodienoate reductase [Pyronema omphalodes]